MELEFIDTDVVVSRQVLRLLRIIVRIVDLNLQAIGLLEVEVDKHLLDELRVEIVMDDLCLANLQPRLSLGYRVQDFFVEDTEGVRLRESVHVGQLLTLEAQLQLLSQSSPAEVRGRKDGSIDIPTASIVTAHADCLTIEMRALSAQISHFSKTLFIPKKIIEL